MNSKSYISIPRSRKGISFLMKVRKNPLNFFINLMQEEGDYAWFEIMGEKVLLLNDALAIEGVLKNQFDSFKKGKFYEVLKPLLGNGIFMTEGKYWKKQREEAMPVFSGKNFDDITQQISSTCQIWINRLSVASENRKAIEMNSESMWFTLDVVLRALFHEERDKVAESMNASMKLILRDAEQRIWGAFLLPQAVAMRLPKYKKAIHFISTLVESLIDVRKNNEKYPEDLLSVLVQNYEENPREQKLLKDQIINFLLAGHETTSNALSWFFYEVTQRPEIKEKILLEIDTYIGSGVITFDGIMKLKYTKAVFQETLRLYPPVWSMSRTSLRNVSLPLENGQNVLVPKDATVMLCSYAVHRRAKYWENPCAFDPDRFLEDKGRPQFCYFPFSLGPRLCIGHKFALIETLVAITMLIREFDFSLVPGQDIKPDPIITLRPNKPVWFNVQRKEVLMPIRKAA